MVIGRRSTSLSRLAATLHRRMSRPKRADPPPEPAADPRGGDPRSGVERIVGRDIDREAGMGRRLSGRARQTQRSVEAYLRGGVRPRWMDRVAEIDARIARERRELASAYRALEVASRGDPEAFEARWRSIAEEWPVAELNELIEQHNEWYPIERRLPVNPRTGDYVLAGGRSYRRAPLGPEWILECFPPRRR